MKSSLLFWTCLAVLPQQLFAWSKTTTTTYVIEEGCCTPCCINENELFPLGELGVEALLVQRKMIRKENLIKTLPGKKRAPLTTANTVREMDWEPGVRAFLRYLPSAKRTIEFSATWVHKFESTNHKNSSTSSYSYTFPSGYDPDFMNAQHVKAHYTSKFWDAEANYWGHITPRNVNYFSVSGVLGLRGMYVGEHFSLAYTKSPDTSTYTARTMNRLIGIQGGGDIQWNPTQRWSWQADVKTGVLADFAKQHLKLGSANNSITLKNFNPSKTFASYILEGNMTLKYRFRPYFNIYAGYRLLGVWNLALAPMQLTGKPGNGGNKVDDTGRIYLHFATLGFNFAF